MAHAEKCPVCLGSRSYRGEKCRACDKGVVFVPDDPPRRWPLLFGSKQAKPPSVRKRFGMQT